MSRRPQVRDGVWQYPTRIYRMECCDCGLVHRVEFSHHKGAFAFRMFRDRRATVRARRLINRDAR